MKWNNIIIMGLLYISSCSTYYSENSNLDNQAIVLATISGKSLSQSGSDEITPYLYRNQTNVGKPILFYASDQGHTGNFDIYYARMEADGRFSDGISLDTNINTSSSEICPILISQYDGQGTLYRLYLMFIRESNNSTNLITTTLNSEDDLTFNLSGPASSLALPQGITGMGENSGQLTLLYGNTNKLIYYFDGYNSWIFSGTNSTATGNDIYSESVFYSSGGTYPYAANIYVQEILQQGNKQLFVDATASLNGQALIILDSMSKVPEAYKSGVNDRWPFVDWNDPQEKAKVYFSSDRSGDFDLYRYNVDSISGILDFYPFDEYLTNHNFTNFTGA